MKIVTVIGTRPQIIKYAILSKAIRESGKIESILIETGQHYDSNMNAVFFEELDIEPPKYSLNVGSSNHGHQTGQMLSVIEEILMHEEPAGVIVFGDTNSTIAGALAASKLNIPVFHIESGLRSFNRRMPEEINRVLTDHISTLLFSPTEEAVSNLRKEGIDGALIYNYGDVMYDAAVHYGKRQSSILDDLSIQHKQFILATIHRAETTDNPTVLQDVFTFLNRIAESEKVVLPLHPRTRKKIQESGIDRILNDNILLIDPVSYINMVKLERSARVIVTDSGGVQKEAYFHKTPCLTLRSETEWNELIHHGWNKLVNPNDIEIAMSAFNNITPGNPEAKLYGGGDACTLIVHQIEEYLRHRKV
ncbi:non-hydrolyzing UDP-N-acetylglucosamine 2-epimerase [Deinococcus sp. JMULE3]|uniref:non-hydrolyzing UDP-N-acetylglucosamine 2-epimerase n=1 Tax=Deinococcus sp. JMULE3 TaxID=2518341 RepID=UPI0015760A3C|nr:UDP-N-acetylglucosamine 2-epimerase (non-hydrolyzing) [Deinococcus sp. JMULE3]